MVNKEGAWEDVRRKGKRILDSGGVTVHSYDPHEIHCSVIGDNGWYDTSVHRKDAFGKGITHFSCSCPWGHHTYQTISYEPYVARPCAHTLAVFWTAQSLDYAYKKIEKSSMKHADLSEDLQDALAEPLDVSSDEEYLDDVEDALGTDDAISGDPVVDDFIEWINDQGYLVDDLPKSTVVSLAIEYVEEAYSSGVEIDVEDLTNRVFGHYFYDPESDPTRAYEPSNDDLGDDVADAVQKAITPVGEGLIHEARTLDGTRFLRVAGTDYSGWEFDDWFLAQEVDLVGPNGTRTAASRTAGKAYSIAEQQALLDEGEGEISEHRKSLQLDGTHYIYSEPVWF